jgi:acetyl esterase/lipase
MGAAFFVAMNLCLRQPEQKIKYTLLALFVILIGIAIWFFRLGGPAQLDLADRLYWGGGERKPAVVETNVHYGPDGDPAQVYDVYHPVAAGTTGANCGGQTFPTLIFFHGGSWRDGNRHNYGFVGRAFAERGFYVVVTDYRKLPTSRYPDFIKDAARVIADIHKTPRPCADPSQLYLMGHSAGAHISMLAALDKQWLDQEDISSNIIAGVIGLAGPYDFLPFTTDAAKAALGKWPKPEETQPIHYARSDAPPLLLLHGDTDETVKPRNSTALAAAILTQKGQAQTKIYSGVDHADIIMAIARPFRQKATVLEDVVAFVKRRGEPSP